MQVRLIRSYCTGGYFEEGEIYDVLKDDIGVTYIVDYENDKLYFDLETGTCSWFQPSLDDRCFIFEEVKDQPKYVTSPEVLAQVFRKMADNVEKGLRPKEGVLRRGSDLRWYDEVDDKLILFVNGNYRLKPETITLKNGIEVPKPLDLMFMQELPRGNVLFTPKASGKGYFETYVDTVCREHCPSNSLFYTTKEEAIEASKALFGLEIKE